MGVENATEDQSGLFYYNIGLAKQGFPKLLKFLYQMLLLLLLFCPKGFRPPGWLKFNCAASSPHKNIMCFDKALTRPIDATR